MLQWCNLIATCGNIMSDYLRIRIPADLKSEAESIFREMGMSISEAVRIFIQQSVNCGALPFTPRGKTPNKETIKAFAEAKNGETSNFTLEEFKEYLKSAKEGA